MRSAFEDAGDQVAISFSGGRTSAYMLYRTLEANNGLPDGWQVVFANTGKEAPETLEFVHECGHFFDVPIVWVEARVRVATPDEKNKYVYETVLVDFDTASRNGEPFAQLIAARQYLPNPVARFCTSDLKVRRINDYLKTVNLEPWVHWVGLRGDEPGRVAKLMAGSQKHEGHESYAPLAVDGVTKHDVKRFWDAQNFDLKLPNNNGSTDLGNCDLCFLKGKGKKLSILHQSPQLADWWAEQERLVGGTFRKDEPGYADLKVIATDQFDLFDFADDDLAFCGCTD